LTARFNTLKDQVAMYEQRARFELTIREQKMEWQMRAYITENNSRLQRQRNKTFK
jgi:hypothetical protein